MSICSLYISLSFIPLIKPHRCDGLKWPLTHHLLVKISIFFFFQSAMLFIVNNSLVFSEITFYYLNIGHTVVSESVWSFSPEIFTGYFCDFLFVLLLSYGAWVFMAFVFLLTNLMMFDTVPNAIAVEIIFGVGWTIFFCSNHFSVLLKVHVGINDQAPWISLRLQVSWSIWRTGLSLAYRYYWNLAMTHLVCSGLCLYPPGLWVSFLRAESGPANAL